MIDRRRAATILAGGVVLAGLGLGYRSLALRQPGPVNTLDSPGGAAIKGYDPVAYFVSGKPMRGNPQVSVTRNGVTWLFANATNKALFDQEPEKFIPAYGGYCAFGVAQGYLVKIEPEAWSIRSGRLYLNYDADVQKQWERSTTAFIEAADRNWPRLVKPN